MPRFAMPRLIAWIAIVLAVVFIIWLWFDQTGRTSDGTQPAPHAIDQDG
jgi:cytochrome c-type biogenesis protein CcmH/NrfF